MRIYVASSWRNQMLDALIALLRGAGHEVYDFRCAETAFAWDDISDEWRDWSLRQFVAALDHQDAVRGFQSDMEALRRSDVVVLVLPCGKSAHLELGWAVGHGKRTFILAENNTEPELMYRMVDRICCCRKELISILGRMSEVTAAVEEEA